MKKPRAFLLMGSGILLSAGHVLAEDRRPTFRLVWLDSPSQADTVREQAMAETTALLDSASAGVVWERTDGRQRTSREDEIQVILLPSAPPSLPAGIMGWTHPGARGARTVWVFLGGIQAALGRPRSLEPNDLGRAVGRVVVHEVIHVIAPERPHSHAGLMAPRVGRRVLLQPRLRLDVHLYGPTVADGGDSRHAR